MRSPLQRLQEHELFAASKFFCLFNSQGFLAKYRIRCFKSNKIPHQKTLASFAKSNLVYPFFKDLEEMRFLLILLRTFKTNHKSLPRRKYCNIRKEIAPLSKLFSV